MLLNNNIVYIITIIYVAEKCFKTRRKSYIVFAECPPFIPGDFVGPLLYCVCIELLIRTLLYTEFTVILSILCIQSMLCG